MQSVKTFLIRNIH